MEGLKLERVKLADLVGDPSNPNFMTEDEIERLRYSIRSFGYVQPIVIDENNIVLDGHQRLEALRREHREEDEVIRKVGLTPIQKKLFRQALNKDRGRHDPLKDADEYILIKEGGADEELRKILGMSEQEYEDAIKLKKMDDVLPAGELGEGNPVFALELVFDTEEDLDFAKDTLEKMKGDSIEEQFLALCRSVKK